MAEEISKCPNCGKRMQKVRANKPYHYTASGLSNVMLQGIKVYRCACGEEMAQIPRMGELHMVIAISLLKKSECLEGDELKFLRKYFRLKATEVAEKLKVTKQTFSRWENGRERIGEASERLVRIFFLMKLVDNAPPAFSRSKRIEVIEEGLRAVREIFELRIGAKKKKKFEINVPKLQLGSHTNPFDLARL